MDDHSAARRELLAQIRERLQELHFAARGVELRGWPARQAMADRVHSIRLLVEELQRV